MCEESHAVASVLVYMLLVLVNHPAPVGGWREDKTRRGRAIYTILTITTDQ